MKRNHLITIILVVLFLTFLIVTPTQQRKTDGSTYGRTPNGYGAWYQYMAERQTPVKRWQHSSLPPANSSLLRVYPRYTSGTLSEAEEQWLAAGGVLVILGVKQAPTIAPYRSQLPSKFGPVLIETSRRYQNIAAQRILGDAAGAIVWQQGKGKGRLILATTPYLGANAYQTIPGNFGLLADLLCDQPNKFVDEYIHGYRDVNDPDLESQPDVWGYLAQTPVAVMFLQVIVLGVIATVALNRRLGRPLPLVNPPVNNSEAYIRAIAAVLQKANSQDFLRETIARAAKAKLQRNLGLGTSDDPSLLVALQQQYPQDGETLRRLLARSTKPMSDRQLWQWLQQWQKLSQIYRQ